MPYGLVFQEQVLTVQGAQLDDGTFNLIGSAVTVVVDSFELNAQFDTVDVSAGQTEMAFDRISKLNVKGSFEIPYNDNSFSTGVAGKILWDNALIRILLTVNTRIFTFDVLRTSIGITGAQPPKLKYEFTSYGLGPLLL